MNKRRGHFHHDRCKKHNNSTHVTTRWIITLQDNTERIVYGTVDDYERVSSKLGAKSMRVAGSYERCSNTVVCKDLCDFSDPAQYLAWQSHNQPHKG